MSLEEITSKTKTILIVDDQPWARDLLKKFFLRKEWAAYTATNAAEAMKLYQQQKYDVLVIDNDMPKIGDGTKLIKQIQKEEKERAPVLCLYSGRFCPENINDVKTDLPGVFIFGKPFSLAEVYAVVQGALQKNQQ